jgi:hypothetical protein
MQCPQLYLLVLQLEDLAHPLPEARASVLESKEDLVTKVLAALNCNTPEDKLPMLMCVRKGKVSVNQHLNYTGKPSCFSIA